MADSLATKARAKYSEIRGRLEAPRAAVRRFLDRVDPNDDPDAEPLGLLPLLVLLAALIWSLTFYWRWKFQPMQDVGHHVAHSAVVADWGRKGSLYTELYEFPNPFNANSLLYTWAGYSGKLLGVTRAFRLCMSFYIVGIPLANLYALRVFGRSPWSALIAVPLVYFNMNYVGGFANLLFAGPFLVMSVPLLYRVLDRFTWKRFAVAALCYVCVFLSHAHVFLWAGVLGFLLTLALFWFRLLHRAPGTTIGGRAISSLKIAGVSLLTVTPSLLLFARWYDWAFGSGRQEGAVTAVTSGPERWFGAQYKSPQGLWHDFPMYSLKVFITDEDLALCWKLGLLTTAAVALGRLVRWRKPPVMEFAFIATLTSYFLLPEAIDTNPVVGSRQTGIALWFLPAMVSVLPVNVSRIARYIVIVGMFFFVDDFFVHWKRHLIKFQQTELNGLEYVMEPAPPRQRLHYVKIASDWSKVFTWRPTWHVEKFYMADRLGQVPDNPAIVSTSAIRYRKGIDPHRIIHHGPDWASWPDLWEYHELVLVRGWTPTPAQLDEAKKHARRIRKEGDWELWRKKGDWEQGNPEAN